MSTAAQHKATNNYRKKALANLSVVISHTEPEVFAALCKITEKHGNRAGAVKAAIVAYADQLAE